MSEVKIEEVRRFIEDALSSAGATETDARDHAALLIHADCTGHFSHGLNRLEYYVNDLMTGSVDRNARPVILNETPGTAWVDGKNTLGATTGNFCMDLAIKKAKEIGVGWVSVKQCNHFGMAGYWALKAEKEGLIGMAFTNSSPLLVPTRAKDRALGTNPIGMAAPAAGGDSLVVDMAMTTVALGKIEIQSRKGEPIPKGWALDFDANDTTDTQVRALGTNPIGMAAPAAGGDSLVVDMAMTTVALGKIEIQSRKGEPIPKGWALDFDANDTTDTQVAFESRRLTPLGGSEETSGYKGYGLSAMVEVFCSALSGSNPTHEVPAWSVDETTNPQNLGQCFVAINPACFNPGFAEHVAKCLQYWRSMTPVDPSLPVLVAGDKEKTNDAETRKRGTIIYTKNQIDSCGKLASKLGIQSINLFQRI